MPEPREDPDRSLRPWSWRLGTLASIPIYIHATFVLLLAWIAFAHLSAGHGVAVAAQGLVLVLVVFAVVVLHELGHALVARRFGIATRDITLYPIGGIARLERMPERPRQELLVAIAGPAVNFALALVTYLALRIAGAGLGGEPLAIGGALAVQLIWINLSLGLFNLLPAFPMDGGRILRATLAFWMDRPRATAAAAHVGRAIAVVLGIVGLMTSFWLALIAVFVWLAAGQEAAMEKMKTNLSGVSVADAMISEFQTLAPDAPVERAAARLASGFQHDFPVVDDGRIVGVLTRADILRGLEHHRGATVAELMHRRFPVAGLAEGLDGVLGRLPSDGGPVVVVHDARVVGLLDPEHVTALLAARGTRPGAAP